jgi:hypothetical protein
MRPIKRSPTFTLIPGFTDTFRTMPSNGERKVRNSEAFRVFRS